MAGWTARELARQTGQPATTVTSWIKSGLITPEKMGRGRGGHLIGVSSLLELMAVIELQNAGFSTQQIRSAVDNLRQMSGYERPLAQLTIVVDGNDIVWKDAQELEDIRFSALHRPGQRLMIFPVGEKHAELLNRLIAQTEQKEGTQSDNASTELAHVS